MEQFRFAREKLSGAAVKTAISSRPQARALSSPVRFGTSAVYASRAGAGVGENGFRPFHLRNPAKETKLPHSMEISPASARFSMSPTLAATETGRLSFCNPSRGPTSTRRTCEGRFKRLCYSSSAGRSFSLYFGLRERFQLNDPSRGRSSDALAGDRFHALVLAELEALRGHKSGFDPVVCYPRLYGGIDLVDSRSSLLKAIFEREGRKCHNCSAVLRSSACISRARLSVAASPARWAAEAGAHTSRIRPLLPCTPESGSGRRAPQECGRPVPAGAPRLRSWNFLLCSRRAIRQAGQAAGSGVPAETWFRRRGGETQAEPPRHHLRKRNPANAIRKRLPPR